MCSLYACNNISRPILLTTDAPCSALTCSWRTRRRALERGSPKERTSSWMVSILSGEYVEGMILGPHWLCTPREKSQTCRPRTQHLAR